jgi:hypothetical protein
MYIGKTLFARVMEFLPWKTFHRIVDRYGGDHRTRCLSCAAQFRVMAFAQLTYRESLVAIIKKDPQLDASLHTLMALASPVPCPASLNVKELLGLTAMIRACA